MSGIYTELQKANLAASKAYVNAYKVPVSYLHRAEPAVTVFARPMLETKQRIEDLRGGKETLIRGFEIYRQIGFPPVNQSGVLTQDADNITIGDGVIFNGHDYRIDEVTDVAGLGQTFRLNCTRCKLVNPAGKAS
jgi:hypothetical protein